MSKYYTVPATGVNVQLPKSLYLKHPYTRLNLRHKTIPIIPFEYKTDCLTYLYSISVYNITAARFMSK